jgi:septal ring factor EnvC (AmiA/AmiB activator)
MAKAKTAFEITVAVPQSMIDQLAEDIVDCVAGAAEDTVLKNLKVKPAALVKALKADPKFLAAAEKEIRRQVADQYTPEDVVDMYEAVDNILENLDAKHELQQLNDAIAAENQRLSELEKQAKLDRDVETLISALEARGYTVSKK